MTYSKDVIDLIEDLRNRTTNNINSIQAGLIPEFVNTQWSIVSYYIYDGKRYDNTDRDVKVIKVNNVRYKSDNGSKDQLVFSENAQKAHKRRNILARTDLLLHTETSVFASDGTLFPPRRQ